MYERSPGGVQPQDASPGRRVDAKVKWFNATKGFGFVTLSDGSPDAFLPMAVLNIDTSTAGPAGDRRGPRQATTLEGAVKWFEPDKGYGFIAPDGGGKDIFIHVTALRRSGVPALSQGQRVRVDVVDGKKGLEADRIVLL